MDNHKVTQNSDPSTATKAALPDPTVDLDWSGYVGAINEIFSRNAKAQPDRPCVIETATPSIPERRFTYAQIHDASNTLAHYLVSQGISNGDVVMIFAHRSVDLVVAIMGTLASGATFSVLDPQYPPARQKVYLEVAQPKALVQIARATEEAGELAPIVRAYLDDVLDLKCEAPELRVRNDGALTGGEVGGVDLFAQVRDKAFEPPDVLVGPDSNPTLSFTSGSEGRPKGVLGRHFSLAYYFNWMAERFQLSSEDRFTMLSGIAHDPIQRDIFTPLFLSATLLVPSKDDIQHEKLAEWMSIHKPTVTHLTPAMGQILVGGATAKFDLKSAFFVGDVLTKRDCKTLQSLAENVNIVNMYGTTETQRAVSYYEIPSRAKNPTFLDEHIGDTVPAGRGMKNVQLLVVNREDAKKICEIGETGEIYVRAGGLSEGYKGDQILNDKKFLQNWFVDNKQWQAADDRNSKGESWRKYYRGPRDRLYRTGDLGKYIESGDVVCTGRADDQVKIRGYRIELGDINSSLGQHALVRDCITLVRRDKDEEPKLVSYIVPEVKQWVAWLLARGLEDIDDLGTVIGPTTVYTSRFSRIEAEIRDHLKGHVPFYALPTDYIILDKLPLNPNGKVDKPNLPFPEAGQKTVEATAKDLERWETLSHTQQTVAMAWAEALPNLNPKIVTRQSNFFDIGGHSLLAQTVLLRLRRKMGANVSITAFYTDATLEGLSACVDKLLSQTNGVYDHGKDQQLGQTGYARALDELLQTLPSSYQTADAQTIRKGEHPTVFLTGATGYLGVYLIQNILKRRNPSFRLIVHVRGVADEQKAFARVQRSVQAYGLWQEEWCSRVSCVVGDLSQKQLGIADSRWADLQGEADIIVHNGAVVHWVKTFKDLEQANVHSTIEAMSLCNTGKPKLFTFVSSTSVLDTPHYINLGHPVGEHDDLEGSRKDLTTGYGQTKWVSEALIREAGRRGLSGSILRPGYILGATTTGHCNTDDFLIRLLKGCIQLRSRPHITNSINAVPVNIVAHLTIASALFPPSLSEASKNPDSDQLPAVTQASREGNKGIPIIHVNSHRRLQISELLALLETYGYPCPETGYEEWRNALEGFVAAGAKEKDLEQHALLPLFHFVTADLPADSRAPELDSGNARRVLEAEGRWEGGLKAAEDDTATNTVMGITPADVGKYLAYLVKIRFFSPPIEGRGKPLPEVQLRKEQLEAAGAMGGRGGMGM